MRHWASTIPNVQFLEVCVESEDVALYFHRAYGFGENDIQYSSKGNANWDETDAPVVVNGWIPSRHYMPVGYGQLGCSGFIIADANGNFVNRKTAAYLQFGDEAFRHVESILTDLLMEMEDEKQKTKPGEAPLAGAMERIPPEVSPSRQNDRKKVRLSSALSLSLSSSFVTGVSPNSHYIVCVFFFQLFGIIL